METIAILMIITLVCVEVYCFGTLSDYIKQISANRTEARREKYRRIAYSNKETSYTKARNRGDLWRTIEK